MPKPRVLVVEDEPTILENVLYALSSEGFEPAGFHTGGAALEALEQVQAAAGSEPPAARSSKASK